MLCLVDLPVDLLVRVPMVLRGVNIALLGMVSRRRRVTMTTHRRSRVVDGEWVWVWCWFGLFDTRFIQLFMSAETLCYSSLDRRAKIQF